jgi:signal peptidase I
MKNTNQKGDRKKKTLLREVGEVVAAFAIAWICYQLLSLATGTALPIVAVVSDSMYHTDSFDNWWENRGDFYELQNINISKEEFQAFTVSNGLSRGDLLFVVNQPPKIGDIVIYEKREQGISIVHRLIGRQGQSYLIKGDNNYIADAPVSQSQIVGKVVFAVPLLGYPRFLLFAFGI